MFEGASNKTSTRLPALTCWDGTRSWSLLCCLLVILAPGLHVVSAGPVGGLDRLLWDVMFQVLCICLVKDEALAVRCEWSRIAVEYLDGKP